MKSEKVKNKTKHTKNTLYSWSLEKSAPKRRAKRVRHTGTASDGTPLGKSRKSPRDSVLHPQSSRVLSAPRCMYKDNWIIQLPLTEHVLCARHSLAFTRVNSFNHHHPWYCFLHLTGEETDAQGGQLTCTGCRSSEWQSRNSSPGNLTVEPEFWKTFKIVNHIRQRSVHKGVYKTHKNIFEGWITEKNSMITHVPTSQTGNRTLRTPVIPGWSC